MQTGNVCPRCKKRIRPWHTSRKHNAKIYHIDCLISKLITTIEELTKAGYIATRTHFRNNSIKTNAQVDEIIAAMKRVLKE